MYDFLCLLSCSHKVAPRHYSDCVDFLGFHRQKRQAEDDERRRLDREEQERARREQARREMERRRQGERRRQVQQLGQMREEEELKRRGETGDSA